MKCPFRKITVVSHKNGDEITATGWQDCYAAQCPAYRAHDNTCAKIHAEPLEVLETPWLTQDKF